MKTSEKELQKNFELLEAIVEATEDVIFFKGLGSRYLMINPAGCEFFGKSIDDIIGKSDDELFPPEVARKIMEMDREIMSSGEPRTFEEHTQHNEKSITWFTS